MNKFKLFESLKQGDLEYLVSPYVSIDQYTSKINNDNITIALFCNEREVANDLYTFLEKMYVIEIKDIEVSSSMTEDNKYILFVEFERNQQFPELLVDVIDSINFLINKELKDWYFVTFGMEKKDNLTIENLESNVRLVQMKTDTDDKNIKNEIKQESIEYSKDMITRKYLDEGYISIDEFEKLIESTIDFNENTLDKEIIEYNNPGCDVVTLDDCCFIIGDKIKKLRML